jgi:hypothetical protein
VGVFRHYSGEDGVRTEHYFDGKWKNDRSLLAYIYWGETGAHAIDLDRARELIAGHDEANKAWKDRTGTATDASGSPATGRADPGGDRDRSPRR